jgi:hypothetical protein
MSGALPDGGLPEGALPEGALPQYTPAVHSVVGLSATVRSLGRRTAVESFYFVAGNTIKLEFTVTNEDGDAVDVTSDTVRFALKKGFTEVLGTDDVTVSHEETDKFVVTIPDEKTSALQGTLRYQCELEDSAGDRATVARGYITFSENLVRIAS